MICGSGLRQLRRLLESQSQNHALQPSSVITLTQGATPTRRRVKVNVFLPFVDHVIQQIEQRFPNENQGLILADRLSLAKSFDTHDLHEVLNYYKRFLTFEEESNSSVEMPKWKKFRENMPFNERPRTANSALSVCSPQISPAIHKILTIFLTTPVRSVSCERFFSASRLPEMASQGF